MKNKQQYKKGNISSMVQVLASSFGFDFNHARAVLFSNFPQLDDHKHCANCGASMAQYIYRLDYHDACLVVEMGKIILGKIKGGKSLSEANQVHVTTEIRNYTAASRQTQCAKLGLIAKIPKRDKDGKIVKKGDSYVHDRSKGWLITRRGFDFLAGKPVPKSVVVFRDEIQDQTEEMTNVNEAFLGVNNKPGIRYHEHNPEDWYDIEGYRQGNLLNV